jgi:transmembrane sensor
MDSRKIEQEAAAWLAQRDGGNWGESQELAFAAWQGQSTAHRIAVIRIKTVWKQADRLQALGAGMPRGKIPVPGSWRLSPFFERGEPRPQPLSSVEWPDSLDEFTRRTKPGALRAMPWRVLVASLVLGIGVASAWYFATYDPNSYRSAIGGIKVVSLSDGSTITLNTNSAIRVALTTADRRIDLERGEAFFEVAKDARRPFVVRTAGKLVVAVGTKFSVFRGALDTRVVVTEGQVKVEELQGNGAVGPVTQVPAGSIAQAGSAGVLVRHASVAEAETYMSWRTGYISLRNTELADAVAEFNRYNRKQLVVADPSIAHLQVGGNLRAANVDAFVRVLEQGFPVHAEDEGNRIVLTGMESQP